MRISFVIAALLLFAGPAPAVVISNTNMDWVPWSGSTPSFSRQATHQAIINERPDQSDFTGVFFKYIPRTLSTPASLQLVDTLLDQGSGWYLVDAGDEFGPTNITAGQFAKMNDWGSTAVGEVRSIPLGDIYLAAQTGSSTFIPPSTIINTPVFGWMRLHNSGTTLTMVDNAVAYDTPGIIVGTTTPLPEPSTLALLIVGALARRRCRSSG